MNKTTVKSTSYTDKYGNHITRKQHDRRYEPAAAVDSFKGERRLLNALATFREKLEAGLPSVGELAEAYRENKADSERVERELAAELAQAEAERERRAPRRPAEPRYAFDAKTRQPWVQELRERLAARIEHADEEGQRLIRDLRCSDQGAYEAQLHMNNTKVMPGDMVAMERALFDRFLVLSSWDPKRRLAHVIDEHGRQRYRFAFDYEWHFAEPAPASGPDRMGDRDPKHLMPLPQFDPAQTSWPEVPEQHRERFASYAEYRRSLSSQAA